MRSFLIGSAVTAGAGREVRCACRWSWHGLLQRVLLSVPATTYGCVYYLTLRLTEVKVQAISHATGKTPDSILGYSHLGSCY